MDFDAELEKTIVVCLRNLQERGRQAQNGSGKVSRVHVQFSSIEQNKSLPIDLPLSLSPRPRRNVCRIDPQTFLCFSRFAL
jgi:hypothetical protein